MRRSVLSTLAITAGLTLAGCTGGGGPGPGGRPGPDPALGPFRLVAYDSCRQAMAGLRRAAQDVVGAYGFAGAGYRGGPVSTGAVPMPADAAAAGSRAQAASPPEHSTTNVQEPGVDEPDLVKTDGRRIVTVARRTPQGLPAGERSGASPGAEPWTLRVIDAASRQVTGTLPLPAGDPAPRWPYRGGVELLLSGDRALLLLAEPAYPYPLPAEDVAVGAPAGAPAELRGLRLLLVDLAGPPRLLSQLTVDGQYVDARQVGATVRVVVRSGPRLRFVYPDGRRSESAAAAENRRVVARSTPADWLPPYELDRAGRTERGQVPCERLSHPAAFTGSSLLTVYTFDLASAADRALDSGDPVSVVADGDTVYGTATALYVATDMAWHGGSQRTEVHRFDLSGPGRPRYVASGEVPGSLLGRYALSEYGGRLRVATTTTKAAAPGPCCDRIPPTQSAVRVLEQRGGALAEVGRVDGLGKGERIYAVRFVGPVGYVVTFRQVDPLYTVDLRDPRHPRVVGELKIRGYSAYLHPAGDGRLIGVGQDATEQGQREGAQVSLFDVRDPARPSRLAAHRVPGGFSTAEVDPHAFLYWPDTGLVVVSVVAPGTSPTGGYAAGALALSLRADAFAVLGTVHHPAAAGGTGLGSVSRALVVGDTLWTLSDGGLQANNVQTLTRRAWLPFT
jgi:hypothetical protein